MCFEFRVLLMTANCCAATYHILGRIGKENALSFLLLKTIYYTSPCSEESTLYVDSQSVVDQSSFLKRASHTACDSASRSIIYFFSYSFTYMYLCRSPHSDPSPSFFRGRLKSNLMRNAPSPHYHSLSCLVNLTTVHCLCSITH